jgi:hypothetical protein
VAGHKNFRSFGGEDMKSKYAIWTLWIYAALLLLGSTRFSVVSWIWGNRAWTWDYFQYSYRNGWGYQYHSDYSFVVVLTYLAAFLLGLIAHLMASARVASAWSTLATILCVLGLISFVIEGSHWFWEHHLSWIAICPAASLLLAAIAIIQLGKKTEQIAGGNAATPSASA